MTTLRPFAAALLAACVAALPARAQVMDESVLLEATASLQRAAAFLVSSQDEDGLWSSHAGITGAVVLALAQSDLAKQPDVAAAITKGVAAIATQAQDDGSFRHPGAADDVYATATCLLALSVARPADPDLAPIAERAYQRLAAHQQPAGPGYGDAAGFRYAANRYPDLSNTQWAIEAIGVYSRIAAKEPSAADRKIMAAAVRFISACQLSDGDDAGAFAYFPPGSEPTMTPHDREAGDTRVWGSLTYGAIKTLRYAGIAPDDPRLTRAVAWTQAHHTVQANPGLDDGGYYYYLYMYATARNQLLKQYANTWQRPLVEALLSRQGGSGQWQNERALWLERDAHLCTAYAILAITTALHTQ